MKAKPSKNKSLTRKLDDLARQICRIRNDDICQKCGTRGPGDWAHIERRAKKALRWEELNSLYLCRSCHSWFDQHVTLGRLWLAEAYPERVAFLVEEVQGIPRSEMIFTLKIPDMEDLVLELKERLKELNGG